MHNKTMLGKCLKKRIASVGLGHNKHYQNIFQLRAFTFEEYVGPMPFLVVPILKLRKKRQIHLNENIFGEDEPLAAKSILLTTVRLLMEVEHQVRLRRNY